MTQEAEGEPRRPGSARRMFCSTILILEVVVLVLTGVVAMRLRLADSSGQVWLVTGVLILLAIVAAGTLRTGLGYGIGSVLQVAVVASGAIIPTMWFLGAVFGGLWIMALALGRKIDSERVARWELERADRLAT